MNGKLKPWELYPHIWKTEKHFLAYLRGAFRAVWSRYPAKLDWKKKQGITPPATYKGKAKKLVQCKQCQEWFPISSTEVDHVSEAGSFTSIDGAWEWFKRVLDVNDNWQLLCKPCHQLKSMSTRQGISLEDAALKKKVIAFKKLSVIEQTNILQSLYEVATMKSLSNAAKRAEAYKQHLLKERAND